MKKVFGFALFWFAAGMIVMMLLVILLLIMKVMPVFNQVFIQLGTEMTGFSRVLMNVGTTIEIGRAHV